MSKVRSRLPPSFSVTVGMYAIERSLRDIFGRLVRAAEQQLSPVDFFGGLRKGVKSRLPQELRGCEKGRGHSRLLKLHYGRPEIHFEAWQHNGAGKLGVG